MAVTTFVLIWMKKPHPPAGATTLIVSLGILSQGVELMTMAFAIACVTALGWRPNLSLETRPAPKSNS